MKKTFLIDTGFSLIEVLITLAIISILMGIAVPIYSQHIVHERRLEAAQILSQLALACEQYHVEHNTYQGASLEELHFPEHIVKNNYQLIVSSANDTYYSLMAKPLGGQAEKDADCGALIIDANGEKNITGDGSVQECW